MTPKVNTLSLTDAELDALNQIVRSHKIEATGQEILMLKFNKQESPILDSITKVVMAWETRAQEVQAEQKAAQEAKAESQPITLNTVGPEE